MKPTTNNLSNIRHIFGKIIFTSQIIVLSAALPVLYCVGVSREVSTTSKVIIIKTNKGKTIMKLADADNNVIPYPSMSTSIDR